MILSVTNISNTLHFGRIMYQAFVPCAPGMLEMAPKGGKLRTLLFSGYADCLVELLAIPILPSNVRSDESTREPCITVRYSSYLFT